MKKRLKRTALLLMTLALLFACLPSVEAASLQQRFENAASSVGAAIVYDLTDDVVLYTPNSTKHIRVASITKVLNACTATQFFEPDDHITVGDELSLMFWNSSTAPVYYGETYTFEQLLHAMLLPSGCDAAYALAAASGRRAAGNSSMSARAALDRFVDEMNLFMKKLGCTDSHFINPDGQDADGQYTTCEEYLRVLKYAVQHPVISQVIRKAEYECYDVDGRYHYFYTTNGMLGGGYPGAIGIKTGTTTYAGYCLATAAERNGKTMISLVVNGPSHYSRYSASTALLDAAFAYREQGDMNHDNRVTSGDARLIMRLSVKLESSADYDMEYADYDGDGEVSPEDARLVLRRSVGLE